MNDNNMNFKEKVDDIIADLLCRIKDITDRKSFTPIFFGIVLALVIIIFAIAGSGSRTPKQEITFTSSAAAGFEDYETELKKDKVKIRLRISDIKTLDKKGNELRTSSVYENEYDRKRIIADLIITNNSKNDIDIVSPTYSGGIALGGLINLSDKQGKDDCMALGSLYDRNENAPVNNGEARVGSKETKEITVCFDYPAGYINKINTLMFCSPWEDGAGEKWEIAGVGKPYLYYRFENEKLFPEVVLGTEVTEPPLTETAPAETTTAYHGQYPWTKINADDGALYFFNNNASGEYELSLELAAPSLVRNSLYVQESGYSNYLDSESIVGIVPEISSEESGTERLRVYFKINDRLKDNTLGTYTKVSDEFKGIRRLNVFMYFEDMNMLLPVETHHDEQNGLVWAETDSLGTYALVDMELWLDGLGISPEDALEQ
ncbi:MAG: hypothetical protein ACI4J0_00595 [Huintestinicola sp.]|uniref:hypothetical protein n=1 Tax=Huintestinicola sp. TaxID=2981661 RepID=UPI003F0381D2